MDKIDVVADFKRSLSGFYGYDEKLKYVGSKKSSAQPTGTKAFLEPRDFLNFAVEDSTGLDKEKNLVNCLGNCKRAIDAPVDRLIGRLGFSPLAKKQGWSIPKKQGWSIPKKLDFVFESGLVAPRTLRNVNTLRNRLEHDHALPSRQQVEDALDVATLFLSYAELVRIPAMNWTLSGGLSVRYDYEYMVFSFFPGNPDKLPEGEPPMFSLAYGDAGFQDFYDFLMKVVPSLERKDK
jgi:hypothetical protein